jgi:hypothetical protein
VRAQGNDRLATNYEKEASVREMDMRDEITRKTKDATKHLFSEWGTGFFGFGGERDIMDAINDTVRVAAISGDPAQINASIGIADILSRYGTSRKAGEKYDKANTFNSLADFKGDALAMFNALQRIISSANGVADRLDGVQVDVTTGP